MTKAALRKRFLAERKVLSDEAARLADRAIVNLLTTLLRDGIWANSTLTLHTFVPILRQREIDTWPVIHWLWDAFPGVHVTSSITHATTRQLAHYRLTPATALTPNRWGIPEPDSVDEYVPTKTIDIVLVPLLAFDRRGHRVGYGGGFYDRFLADCRPDCQKIGLSWFDPVDLISDTEPTDVALNACVTPRCIHAFTS